MHPAALPAARLLAEVDEIRSRGTGPGGQRRNKVQTQVRLRHRPTGIGVQAGERRSLEQNRREALWRLRLALALGFRASPEPGDEGVPSALWRRRTSGPALSVAVDHDDVPALLAEALDVLAACDDDLAEAALRLGVSGSRLLRVLRLQPSALEALNRRLRAAGRPAWH